MKQKKITLILLFAIIVIFISISYAVYKLNTSSTQTLQAASFSVSANSEDTDVSIVKGQTPGSYSLKVKNDSEVSVTYKIILKDLPDGIKVKLDDGEYVEETDNEITFDDSLELTLTGVKEKEHTLTFSAPLDSNNVTDKEISIDVEFKQKY